MEQATFKISVIVPSFNQALFIEETLQSIFDQAYDALEIIVIDGGSTDGSVDIIKKYAPKLTYWISEKDSGQSEAINKGFDIASGDIITWLNSDDCYEPGALLKVAEHFRNRPELAILHGKSILFGKDVASKTIGLDHDIQLHEYFPYMRFPQPSSFFKRTNLNLVLPVNNALHYAMDFELIVKMLLNGSKIERSNFIFSKYRLHETSKSNHHLLFLKDWSLVAGNFFSSISGDNKYRDLLVDLNLLEATSVNQAYTSILQFTERELELIFLEHLNICYHYNYGELNKRECYRLSGYMKINFPAFYDSNNYKKYNNRLKFIPKFVFNLIRTTAR